MAMQVDSTLARDQERAMIGALTAVVVAGSGRGDLDPGAQAVALDEAARDGLGQWRAADVAEADEEDSNAFVRAGVAAVCDGRSPSAFV